MGKNPTATKLMFLEGKIPLQNSMNSDPIKVLRYLRPEVASSVTLSGTTREALGKKPEESNPHSENRRERVGNPVGNQRKPVGNLWEIIGNPSESFRHSPRIVVEDVLRTKRKCHRRDSNFTKQTLYPWNHDASHSASQFS